MECNFKHLALTSSKFCLYSIDLYNNLEKRIKNGGHHAYFLSGKQNLPLRPHILKIIQYKTLWNVLLNIWH